MDHLDQTMSSFASNNLGLVWKVAFQQFLQVLLDLLPRAGLDSGEI